MFRKRGNLCIICSHGEDRSSTVATACESSLAVLRSLGTETPKSHPGIWLIKYRCIPLACCVSPPLPTPYLHQFLVICPLFLFSHLPVHFLVPNHHSGLSLKTCYVLDAWDKPPQLCRCDLFSRVSDVTHTPSIGFFQTKSYMVYQILLLTEDVHI